MLRSVPMVHMQIQVPNREAAAVTRHIAAQGMLHLIDIAHGRIANTDAAPPGTRELLAAFHDLARRIRRICDRIDVALPDLTGALASLDVRDYADERLRIEERLRPIELRVDEMWRARNEARERAGAARAALNYHSRIAGAGIDPARLARLKFASVALGLIRADEMTTLASVLAPAPFAILPLDASERDVLAAAVVPASARDRLEGALRVVSFERIDLDNPSLAAPEADAILRQAEAAEQQAKQQLSSVCDDLRHTLTDLAHRAELASLLLQAQTHFAAAGRFVVISGWIPEAHAARMSHAIAALTDSHAIVEVQKPEDLPEAAAGGLQIPILYRNPVLLRPFQALVQMYGVPSYGEIQPTTFFAVSFLLMFGVMFGDVGQGLVLFSAGYCLWRWLPRFLDYGVLLMECGAASVAFGVLYGSVFGIEDVLPVLWMHPIRDLSQFMAVAIGFGVLIVSVGLAINIVNSWRAGERVPALFGPHGVFGAFMYWTGVAVITRALVPTDVTLPFPILIGMISIPILLLLLRHPIVKLLGRTAPPRAAPAHSPVWLTALEGSVELVDAMFGFFANTISFVRVAAFAAVHAGIFVAVFALADTLAESRFGQPLGLVTIVAGNVLMVLLEGLTVSVQVLRLEYYEFFGKFFRGGGEVYRPLMLRKGGTS